MALQNHKNMQHDADSSCSESDQVTSFMRSNDQILNDFCGFKFIPRTNPDLDTNTSVQDGITTRTFTEDISYLIVKIEGYDLDLNLSLKRSRLEGAVKKAKHKAGKPLVDLRGPFTCTLPSELYPGMQCRQIFFNCCDYSMHYREEHTKRRKAALRCQVCEKRLDTDQSHSVTALQQPVNRITFACRICGQTFLTGAQYDEHNRTVHAKIKPHQCSICAKRFTQQGGLQQHMRMHTGVRPFVCSFCPKAFTQKAGLDQHLRVHTKIKPFKCVICSKCFSQSVHLRQHMRTHTNIQPFECFVCGKRFKQSSHLNFHMRSHVGETSSLVVERYAQEVPQQNQLEFLNLANLQPIQDGETLYYAAELAAGPPGHNSFNYQSQEALPENVLSF
ncbi:zinc finger and SCAN domain-containing protein 22-like isoform X2 [Plodia interpunctella]|nr:zinc finger and SCAN domain-containing protein 22-like isoform X2 [Plodia interpunctella]XP_053624724.1 zinc finger and SCAN domain-containing protein 22-like isoform X2 [Plodia interpunctella]